MPLIGISCQKHGLLSFEEALSGKCDCTPRFILDSIISIAKQDYHTGNKITATTLLGCLRETYLQRTYDYYATIQQIYYSWRGTLIHSILERPNLEGWHSEELFSKKITLADGRAVEISGKIDGYDEPTKTLWDIKTIGDKGISFIVKDGAKEDHIPQVNIYRLLSPFQIERLRIIYLSMMTFVQTGQMNEMTQSYKYPPRQKTYGYSSIKLLEKNERTGYGKYKLSYDTAEVPTWTDEKTIEFIKPKATILLDAFDKNIIPQKCDKKTQAWKCCRNYCNVFDICKKLEGEENEKRKSTSGATEVH